MTDYPKSWQLLPFDACVVARSEVHKPSIARRAYKPAGKFPVVDQGADLIAGFTDDAGSVYNEHLPIIVFGDHTRVLKFIDFPFATGADGTKLLHANQERIEPRFLFYALKNLQLDSRGYNRHYGLLRDSHVLVPESISEQRAIAAVLSKIQAAAQTQGNIVAALKELKAATMAKLFQEGLSGEPLKQSELGQIPQSWKVVELGQLCQIGSGGTPARDNPQYWNGKIPWVKTGEINYRRIAETEEHITEKGLDSSAAKIFPRGTVLMAMYGQGVTRGRVAILNIDATTNQACAALIPGTALDSEFLYSYCEFSYDRIRDFGHGANQKNLSIDILKRIPIPLPKNLNEQRQTAGVFRKLDEGIAVQERRQSQLQTIFTAVLHSLMTGEVRISDVPVINILRGQSNEINLGRN